MKPKNMYVYCTTRFVAFHCWPNAPDSVDYLRFKHRHEFRVKVTARTAHDNRYIEFITLKLQTDDAIKSMLAVWTGTASCEQVCQGIANRLTKDLMITSVEVSEDGENGAVVTYE